MKRKRDISLHTLYTKYVVIDHVKEDEKSNNSVENLNPTTTKGNNTKSAKLNPGRKKDKGTRPIQGKKIGETVWVDYTGATEASEDLGLYQQCVTAVCKNKRHKTKGYVFRYKDDPDLEGEIWVENKHVGILVSNMGRVKTLVKTKGTIYETQFYYSVNVNKKMYKVHRLVCQAFKWEEVLRKFAQQRKYTDIYSFWNKLHVDHIDSNKTNNHIDNLQPLTAAEHCKKTDHNIKRRAKTRSKPILGKKDGDWVPYSGLHQAARELKDISYGSIQRCLKGNICFGYQFKYAPDPDLDGEIWKDVPQEFFKHSVKGWRVSNKGRVHSKSGVKCDGTERGKYKVFGNHILVHRAVAAAFMQDQIMEVLRSQHVL